jgi:hypothetical protein
MYNKKRTKKISDWIRYLLFPHVAQQTRMNKVGQEKRKKRKCFLLDVSVVPGNLVT